MSPVLGVLAIFSVLVPQKIWFAPNQPLTVNLKSDTPVELVLTDFAGKPIGKADAPGATFDVKHLFPDSAKPGTYVLYAAAKTYKDGTPTDFAGTPLVIEVRNDKRNGAPPGPDVTKVEPLRYMEMTTDLGKLTCIFYYDVAPNTVDSFLSLGEGGYFDGLVFHRIIPGFVIQGGDPRGSDPNTAGTGGPGFTIPAEFNDHPHKEGVLSMARSSDPDSAGSQFFICLDYAQTQQLDNKYTVYGKVVDGLDVVKKIAAVPTGANDRPNNPPAIQKVQVLDVTKDHDPYAKQ